MQFELFDLGLVDYLSAWDFQRSIFLQVKQGRLFSAIIICRHQPVITKGRGSKRENILANEEQLNNLNIKTYEIERGGDVTYHGPGQLCVYPIVNLAHFRKDINWFLRNIETLLIDVLSDFGIGAQSLQNLRGVWINKKKIASIGIAIRNWITYHGVSLNIKEDDLANFSLIRPCGMDIIMTSMESILKKEVKVNKVKEILIRNFKKSYFCDFTD